jgi:hypothetical protein
MEFSSLLISAEVGNELSVDKSYLSASCLATSGRLNADNSQSGYRISVQCHLIQLWINVTRITTTSSIEHLNARVYLFDLFKANCLLFSVTTLQVGEANKSRYHTTLLSVPLNTAEPEMTVHICITKCPILKHDGRPRSRMHLRQQTNTSKTDRRRHSRKIQQNRTTEDMHGCSALPT